MPGKNANFSNSDFLEAGDTAGEIIMEVNIHQKLDMMCFTPPTQCFQINMDVLPFPNQYIEKLFSKFSQTAFPGPLLFYKSAENPLLAKLHMSLIF